MIDCLGGVQRGQAVKSSALRIPLLGSAIALALAVTSCHDTKPARLPARLWTSTMAGPEKLEAVSSYIDAHVGADFPDIPLTEAATGVRTSLYGISKRRILLLNIGSGCPFSMADIAYFRSRSWRYDEVEIVIPIVDKHATHLAKACGPAARLFVAEYPLPGWLGRLYSVPQSFIVDGASRRLLEWKQHVDGAWGFIPAKYKDSVPDDKRSIVGSMVSE